MRFLKLGNIFVARLCTTSIFCSSALVLHPHTVLLYSSFDRIRVLNNIEKFVLFKITVLQRSLTILLAFASILFVWNENFNFSSNITPRSFTKSTWFTRCFCSNKSFIVYVKDGGFLPSLKWTFLGAKIRDVHFRISANSRIILNLFLSSRIFPEYRILLQILKSFNFKQKSNTN